MGSERERTIAAAAIGSARPAVSSSFRFHRPRGPVCGRGYCSQCEVETAHGRALACETPAPARRTRRRPDPLRPLGRVAERWPPWFYERRFLRTELVRRASLDVLRRVSGAGRLGPAVPLAPPRRFEEVEAETVVVGDAPGVDAGPLVVATEDVLGVYPDRTLGVLRDDVLLEVRFERLVLATGSYDRLPPVAGNDLPGVIGLPALERYAPELAAGTRIAVWGADAALDRARRVAGAHGLAVVWAGSEAPRRLTGRGRVAAVDGVPCRLFVTCVEQPAVELALQAGASVSLTAGELPVLVVDDTPQWLEARGAAARRSSGVPDAPPQPDAFACLCEDVRVRDLQACVAEGFAHPELVKRRTGAMTGPCQGKLCAATVLGVLRDEGVDVVPTTARPLLRPTPLRELAAHV